MAKPSLVLVQVDYVAPVPVGHWVQVIYYAAPVRGVFSNKIVKHELNPTLPWLRDLDTGIEYSANYHHGGSGANPHSPSVFPLALRDDLVIHSRVEGRVEKCSVLTERVASVWMIQTRLVIDPSARRSR